MNKKIIHIDTKMRWKIGKSDSCYVAVCDRLKLSIDAPTLNELKFAMDDAMTALFIDLWDRNEFFDYTFKASIAYRIEELENNLDIIPTPIIVQ